MRDIVRDLAVRTQNTGSVRISTCSPRHVDLKSVRLASATSVIYVIAMQKLPPPWGNGAASIELEPRKQPITRRCGGCVWGHLL